MKKITVFIATLIVAFLPNVACSCGGNEADSLTSYKIEATYDGDRTVTAKMTVDYVNDGDGIVDELYFHLYPQAYREGARFCAVPESERATAYPNGISYGGIEITALSSSVQSEYEIEGQDEDILALDFDGEIEPDQRVSIEIAFTLTLPEVRHRLGKMGDVVNLGNWYPVLCADVDGKADTSPYYDKGDPFVSDIANYEVKLIVPGGYNAVTSGMESVREVENNVVIESKAEKMRDFAVVIGKFDSLSADVNGVRVSYYYTGDANAENSLKCAVDAIKTFSKTFGEYPYGDYDVVQTAFLHGGMEYPGLSMISDALKGDMYSEAIVHETAHQWWYAVVGSDQINHAWLDEGLTEYSTTLFYELNDSYGVSKSARLSDATSAYLVYLDTTASKNYAMDRRVSDFETQLDYTFLTYVKGELMFDSVRTCVGDEKFFTALKSYYKNNKFKIATPAHLIAELEKAGGVGMESFINVWLSGKDVVCK